MSEAATAARLGRFADKFMGERDAARAELARVTAERDRLRTASEGIADAIEAYVAPGNGRKAAHYVAGHKHAAKMVREAVATAAEQADG